MKLIFFFKKEQFKMKLNKLLEASSFMLLGPNVKIHQFPLWMQALVSQSKQTT